MQRLDHIKLQLRHQSGDQEQLSEKHAEVVSLSPEEAVSHVFCCDHWYMPYSLTDIETVPSSASITLSVASSAGQLCQIATLVTTLPEDHWGEGREAYSH